MTTIEKVLTQINIPRTSISVKETIEEANRWGKVENIYNIKVNITFINTSEEVTLYNEYLPSLGMSLEEASEKFTILLSDIIRELTTLCIEKHKADPYIFEKPVVKIISAELTPEEGTSTLLSILDIQATKLNDKTEL